MIGWRDRRPWWGLGAIGLALLGLSGLWLSHSPALTPGPAQAGQPGSVKILVNMDGPIRLPSSAVQPFGVDLRRSDLRLTLGNPLGAGELREAPFDVVDHGPEPALVFYGQANDSPFSAENVYWLTTGGPAGIRLSGQTGNTSPAPEIAAAESATRTVRLEIDQVYQALAGPDEDHWYWAPLYAPGTITETVVLTDIRPSGSVLRVGLWSSNSALVQPDHHVQVRVNDQLVGEDWWDGIASRVVTVTVPVGGWHPGANTISIQAPGDTGAQAELVMLNWLAVDYQAELRFHGGQVAFQGNQAAYTVQVEPGGTSGGAVSALDVTDPGHPLRLATAWSPAGLQVTAAGTGLRRYQIWLEDSLLLPEAILPARPATLQSRTTGVEYLAIAPASLAPAVQPLLDWRKQAGLTSAVVDLQDIYDEFGAGQPTPVAIRDFLRFSRQHWSPAPRFVLLVGDASYDYRNHLRARNRDWLPTPLVQTEYSGETASDVWYTLLDEDALPDIAVGRLPAQTPEEVRTMVDKILAYERSPGGDWRQRALLVADNDEPGFRLDTDDLATRLQNQGYTTDELTIAQGGQTHSQILAELDQGVAILNYVGHGSLDVWGNEKALQTEDAAALKNGDRLPILTTYTCLNGFFHHPSADSLAEALLWQPNGGVVAAIVPSGRSLSSDQKPLAEGFYTALLDAGAPRLGEALLRAQRTLPVHRGGNDVLMTFNLLGDPALKFAGPSR